ncbi:MAG: sigma-70 family RNA polymerase sigma factor [Bacillota bacterium]|nr:sigma-70 family RNA polymerase sigma factor [Bacillota bacterium]
MELEFFIAKVKAGENQYFNNVVSAYQQQIYNLAFKMIGHQEDARDITQEVFIKVYNNITKYDDNMKFSTWIFRIATNSCIDFLRKKKEILLTDESIISTTANKFVFVDERKGESPQQIMERKLLKAHINEKINQLPEHYRLVIILKYINDFTLEEIAAILNESLNTVKTRLYRGRELLKNHLIELKERSDY